MTNRERLLRAAKDIQTVKKNMVIGPTAYEHLSSAVNEIIAASNFALDENEQDRAVPSFSR